MIKIWTWAPLEPKCYYADDVEKAAAYIDKEIDAYEEELLAELAIYNEQIIDDNKNVRSEVLKKKLCEFQPVSVAEIMDMFTVFNCKLNTLFRDLKKERDAKPKSNY